MVAPNKFAHVVFNTHRYDEMIDWYARVFEARVQHRDDRLAFLTYDDEHHRFAFVNLGPAKDGAEKRPAMAPGLNHLGYTWRNLEELIDTYDRLKGQASCRRGQSGTDRRCRSTIAIRMATGWSFRLT